MKSMILVAVFALASANMMRLDVRTVEIAQAQRGEATMLADERIDMRPVLVAAR